MLELKVYQGTQEELNSLTTIYPGTCFFTIDTNNLYVDFINESGIPCRGHVNASGAIYATAAGKLQSGENVLNINEIAKINEVYKKTETDNLVNELKTKAYSVTLATENWVTVEDGYEYHLSLTDLSCIAPPLIYCTENLEEYSKIISADATANQGIVFKIKEIPANINIIIYDVK